MKIEYVDEPYGYSPVWTITNLAALFSIEHGHERIERDDMQQAVDHFFAKNPVVGDE